MPSANQSVDTVLLKTGVGSNPGDTPGKSASDSNISKNSFNAVYDKERASSHDRQRSDSTDANTGVRNAISKNGESADTAINENRADSADGKQATDNGKTLPLGVRVDENGQAKEQADLAKFEEDSKFRQEEQVFSELTENGDAQNKVDLELNVQADQGSSDINAQETKPASDSEGLVSEDASSFIPKDGKPTRGVLSDVDTTITNKPGIDSAKASSAAQPVITGSDTMPSRSQAALNSNSTDESMLVEERFETNLKSFKTGESEKPSVGLDRIKIAQAASAAQPESADLVKQQARGDGAQLVQQLSATPKLEASTTQIQAPLNSPNWGQAVAQRVLLMAKAGVQAAQLQLHPRELGPVEVRISMVNEQAQVQFSSQYSVVRETLESSLPRLREMFEGSNLELLDANVSDQTLAERDTNEGEGGDQRGSAAESDELEPLLAHAELEIQGRGLVDYYA